MKNSVFYKISLALAVVTLLTGISAAQQEKVTICHNGVTTIDVAESAVSSHLEHGDTEGPCTPIPPVPELNTAILMSAGITGLLGFSRLKKN